MSGKGKQEFPANKNFRAPVHEKGPLQKWNGP
jgi:hypothetical protein